MTQTPPLVDNPECLVTRQGPGEHILVIELNRPEARNALSTTMLAGLDQAWDLAEQDDSIRVVVLTGSGGNFCAGMDLKKADASSPGDRFEAGTFDPRYIKPLLKGRRVPVPVITAVEGYAIAGGTELTVASDIRVAGRSAQFGLSEVALGLYPLGGSVVRMPRQMPYTVAVELLVTGRRFGADEAKSFGFIGHVVDDGHALAHALTIAEQIAGNGPVAVRAIMQVLRETEVLAEHDAWELDGAIGGGVFRSADAKEGPRSFVEKRRPIFQGR